MNALSQQAARALASIQAATARREAAEAAARAAFHVETANAYQSLNQLQTEYSDKAVELASAKRAAPRSRYGMELTPDNIEVTADGIELQWYAQTGPDDWFTATWEDLAAGSEEGASHVA